MPSLRTTTGRLSIAAGAWLTLFACATLVTRGRGVAGHAVVDVAYLLPHLLAFALAVRAVRRTEGAHRRLWLMLALALPLWITGEAVVSGHHILGTEPPFPSVADGFFLAFYLMLILTFVVAVRPVLVIRSWKAVLDASVLAATVGYVGWFALIAPQVSDPASVATIVGIAYPLLDVVMLTILISLTLAAFHRPPLSLALLAGGIVIGALTDCALTYTSLHTAAPELSWLKIGWEAEALLLAAAAVAAVRATGVDRARATLRDQGLTVVLGGVAATLTTVCIVAVTGSLDAGGAAAAFYVVAATAVRLSMTSREREQIALALEASLIEQHRIADTDELTGLHNRRFADRRLHERIDADPDATRTLAVLVLDLDHFKQINDSYGHAVGDEVLRVTSRRLAAVGRTGDVIARYGGEEFLVILRDVSRDGSLQDVAERYRASIADQPYDVGADELIVVTTSIGGASMPADAATMTDLLRIADRALYTSKSLGRNRVQVGARADDGGIDALAERGSVLNFVQSLVDHIDARHANENHGCEAARYAGLVADEMGLSSTQRWRACAAARLHDIGKLCVPPDILKLPGPLDPQQWALVRRHPDAGADILALAPGLEDVAAVVRQHHERHDGEGYPLGLAGEAIRVEARIVAVCDAWTAMRADRVYRRALPESVARAELRRGAGEQFDPEVADALLRVTDSERTSQAPWSRPVPA